jgi:hypothetical protein
MNISSLTQENLRKILHYDRETGVFTWLARRSGVKYGKAVGSMKDGYLVIRVHRRLYRAHRLAWLYMTGDWPSEQIDHIDGNRANNSWKNLREADYFVNAQNERKARSNSKTGFLGVIWSKGKFQAEITVGRKSKYLGRFSSAAEAHDVYLKAKRALHEGCTI